MNGFLSMGGYAAFVWPCFFLTAVVLVWNVVAARRLHDAARRKVLSRAATGKGKP
jgi:heme exporter protein CcmD